MFKILNKKNIIAAIILVIIGFISIKIPFTNIVGSGQNFSVFDFYGPTLGMFLGPVFGVLAVILVKLFPMLFSSEATFDLLTMLRFLPMMCAAIYLGVKGKKTAIIAAVCMVAFILHPIGQEVWFFSLFWLIPIAASFKKDNFLVNAFGSTFTAHAVGSTLFLYALNLPAELWISLIPVVILERFLFATGIWVTYIVLNNVLDILVKRYKLRIFANTISPAYTFLK